LAESMTVSKSPPTELPAIVTASGVMNGITIAWSKLNDKSIVKLNFYLNANPFFKDLNPDITPVASVSADSTVKTITGLNNGTSYKLFIESEDAYGLTTHIAACQVGPDGTVGSHTLFGGFSTGPSDDVIIANIPAVTVEPTPPNAPTGTWLLKFHVVGWTDDELINPNSGKQVYFTLSAARPVPGATGTFLYLGGYTPTGSATVTAVAYYRGVESNFVRTFTYVAAANSVVAPSFNPKEGAYYEEDGILDVVMASPNATDLFYTTDLTNPTHSGTTNTPTGTTKRIAAGSQTFSLPVGKTTIKAIGYRATWTDSPITTANFTVVKSKTSGSTGGIGGGIHPQP
jgi:hypothetical protein